MLNTIANYMPETPVPPTILRRSKRYRLDPELGWEKQCTHCLEWWPADGEFFHNAQHESSRLHPWCRDCCGQARRDREQRPRLDEWTRVSKSADRLL